MKHSRVIHRALALAAGTALATAAALAVPAAASAHHSIVQGSCASGTDGSWIVTWTVANSEKDIPATVKTVALTPTGTTVTNIKVGASIPAGGKITGQQTVPADQKQATLTISSEWIRNGKPTGEWDGKPKSDVVTLEKGKCAPAPEPEPTPSKSADVPPAPTPTATPTMPPLPGNPDVTIKNTCKDLSVTFVNPKDGEGFEVTLTPSNGEKVTVKVAAGETVTRTFPASEGFSLKITAGGESVTVPWEEPEDCDGGLPVTGTAVSGIAGSAVVLLAVGLGMFLVARRRRIRFTA